jgi:pyruvate/2-oxoglutarate dehydrogenase complex dihydrolipoamide dehydrogenase (E3) component
MLNTPVSKEFAEQFEPDVLAIAIGAEPIILPIPGMDGDNVIISTQMYDNGEPEVGHKVAIMGGGLVGCEIGLDLFNKGHEVHIVEMQDDVAPECNHYHKIALMAELERGVNLHLGVRATEVTPNGIKAVDVKTGEEVFIEGDTVISSVGLRSLTAKTDELMSARVPEIFTIGDCIRPQQVTQAVHAGYNAAMDM